MRRTGEDGARSGGGPVGPAVLVLGVALAAGLADHLHRSGGTAPPGTAGEHGLVPEGTAGGSRALKALDPRATATGGAARGPSSDAASQAGAVAGSTPAPRPAAEALAEFWGERWPEVRLELFGRGELPADLPDVQPWEVVEDLVRTSLAPEGALMETDYRGRMAWPGWSWAEGAPDPEGGARVQAADLARMLSEPAALGLDAEAVLLIDGALLPAHLEVDGKVREFLAHQSEAMAAVLARDGLERAPIRIPHGPAGFRTDRFGGRTCSVGGWQARVSVEGAAAEELRRLMDELRVLKDGRRERLRELVAEALAVR